MAKRIIGLNRFYKRFFNYNNIIIINKTVFNYLVNFFFGNFIVILLNSFKNLLNLYISVLIIYFFNYFLGLIIKNYFTKAEFGYFNFVYRAEKEAIIDLIFFGFIFII